MREFYKVREKLTVTDDNILIRGTNVVILEYLRDQAVALMHESHQGILKTKELIRNSYQLVWFPKMNDKVETAVRQCFACQCTYNGNPHIEPMQMSDMPTGPWRELNVDILGHLPSGEELMVLVDSRDCSFSVSKHCHPSARHLSIPRSSTLTMGLHLVRTHSVWL